MVTVQAKKLYVKIQIIEKQISRRAANIKLCKVGIKVMKILEDIISKRCTSSKQRKLARCCRAARYRHAHCTYISAQKKSRKGKCRQELRQAR